jgi:hypothetical protein
VFFQSGLDLSFFSISSPGKKPMSRVGTIDRTITTFLYVLLPSSTSRNAKYIATNVLPVPADPDRIIISTNNDADNNFAGNSAAEKMQQSLFEFFNKNQIEIRLPKCKDWGESSKEEINNILNG